MVRSGAREETGHVRCWLCFVWIGNFISTGRNETRRANCEWDCQVSRKPNLTAYFVLNQILKSFTFLAVADDASFTTCSPTKQSWLKSGIKPQMNYCCASGSAQRNSVSRHGSLKLAKTLVDLTLSRTWCRPHLPTPSSYERTQTSALSGASATCPTPKTTTSSKWTTKSNRLSSKLWTKSTTSA